MEHPVDRGNSNAPVDARFRDAYTGSKAGLPNEPAGALVARSIARGPIGLPLPRGGVGCLVGLLPQADLAVVVWTEQQAIE